MRVVDIDEPDGSIALGRSLPSIDRDSERFWKAAAEGSLLVQKCVQCTDLQFYPRALCRNCAADVEWVEVSGRGTVYTFTVIRQNLARPFADIGPYVVAMVALDEGPMMLSNITGVDPGDIRIGMAVSCYAVRMNPELGLPFWEAE
jgi:uncharacterized OB-fold protein